VITLVQVSTDYVFDGASGQPYHEDDPPAPRTAHGRSNLTGERAVLDLIDDERADLQRAFPELPCPTAGQP
jgi:dTDP-4-dehydrorhamnose reductase